MRFRRRARVFRVRHSVHTSLVIVSVLQCGLLVPVVPVDAAVELAGAGGTAAAATDGDSSVAAVNAINAASQ